MRVRCRATRPTTEQLAAIGSGLAAARAAGLAVGSEYTVLGLQFETHSVVWGTGPWARVAVGEDLVVAPLCLFDIVEERASRHWRVRRWQDGSVTLWPEAFYADYFLNDVKRKKPAALDELRRICELLAAEAEADPP